MRRNVVFGTLPIKSDSLNSTFSACTWEQLKRVKILSVNVINFIDTHNALLMGKILLAKMLRDETQPTVFCPD